MTKTTVVQWSQKLHIDWTEQECLIPTGAENLTLEKIMVISIIYTADLILSVIWTALSGDT